MLLSTTSISKVAKKYSSNAWVSMYSVVVFLDLVGGYLLQNMKSENKNTHKT